MELIQIKKQARQALALRKQKREILFRKVFLYNQIKNIKTIKVLTFDF